MAANPTSESELQLYRVLQRANLLQYFETFISQGGDDVQQLCEAGEEEFLEIMALVGMASKPLHVRRLQKVLQEWVTSPAVFHQPLGPHTPAAPIAPGSILASVQRPYLKMNQPGGSQLPPIKTPLANWQPPSETTPAGDASTPGPLQLTTGGTTNTTLGPVPKSVSPVSVSVMESGLYPDGMLQIGLNNATATNLSNNNSNSNSLNLSTSQITSFPADSPDSGSPTMMDDQASMASPGSSTPALTDGQVAAIERAAGDLAKTLPQYEPRPLNAKKLINKEIEEVMKMPEHHPERMDLLRKYGCIYGRFDSRRKNEKHLSLHEVSVNEASAQLCKHRVSLLTRRDDLFPLARQVVRDSGYQYSKGHSRGQTVEIPPNKKQKMEKNLRMAEINRELSSITIHQQRLKQQILQAGPGEENSSTIVMAQNELQALVARQLLLLSEQGELVRKQRMNRSQCRQTAKSQREIGENGTPKEDEDDDDEDSIPFPSEPFSSTGAEDEYFGSPYSSTPKDSNNEPKDYSMYSESQRLAAAQRYALDAAKLDERGEIVIKQEVGAEDVENSLRESGLEPGEVDLSWSANKRLFGQAANTSVTALGRRFGDDKRKRDTDSSHKRGSEIDTSEPLPKRSSRNNAEKEMLKSDRKSFMKDATFEKDNS